MYRTLKRWNPCTEFSARTNFFYYLSTSYLTHYYLEVNTFYRITMTFLAATETLLILNSVK